MTGMSKKGAFYEDYIKTSVMCNFDHGYGDMRAFESENMYSLDLEKISEANITEKNCTELRL